MTERVEPRVDLVQGRRVDRIEAPGAYGPDGREAALPQHLEMLRDGRLRDAELVLDGGRDRAGCLLPLPEQLEDPPSNRVTEDVERVHGAML